MEAYFAAKRKLFDGSIGKRPARSIINLDDPLGAELKALCGETVMTYALDAKADITTEARNFGLDGLQFVARTPAGPVRVNSSLVGRLHAYNILCAIGVGLALGFDCDDRARRQECRGVPGRFERVTANGHNGHNGEDVTVIVDYAHTPDALVNTLRRCATRRPIRAPPAQGPRITVSGRRRSRPRQTPADGRGGCEVERFRSPPRQPAQ